MEVSPSASLGSQYKLDRTRLLCAICADSIEIFSDWPQAPVTGPLDNTCSGAAANYHEVCRYPFYQEELD